MRVLPLTTGCLLAIACAANPAFALTGRPAPLAADPKMEVAGTLTCQVAPGLGLGIGSSRPGTCIFDHIGAQGFSESYDSRFERVGFDIGIMGTQSFKLTVLTPNGDATPGMLAGSNSGRSSETSLVKAEGLKVAFHSDRQPIAFEQSADGGWVGLSLGSGDTTLLLDNPHGI